MNKFYVAIFCFYLKLRLLSKINIFDNLTFKCLSKQIIIDKNGPIGIYLILLHLYYFRVTDVNDNAPVFVSSPYYLNIRNIINWQILEHSFNRVTPNPWDFKDNPVQIQRIDCLICLLLQRKCMNVILSSSPSIMGQTQGIL